MKTCLAGILCLSMLQTAHAQTLVQLIIAESYHAMKNDSQKIKTIRKLEKDGWFAIDTFTLLDKTMTFRKTDLSPYIDDNGNTVFLVADASPEFPGGKAALQKVFADSLGDIVSGPGDEVQNSIYIKFLVDIYGNITEVEEAQKHPDWLKPEIIKTCLNTVEAMPKWSPGIFKDEPVKVKMLVSVNLKE